MVEENIGLEAITDSKIVNLRSMSKLMGDILSGKINNKYDAEKIYREIMKDENLLRNCKKFSTNENDQTIATIILHYLESEKEAEKRQKGHGLKIMTPSQLITRLPILLAQKQAGNNSQKFSNEIRQIIYSLYRSKNLSKTVHNHLINSI